MDNVAQLVTTKPDAEVAEELRKEAIEVHKPVIEFLTKAHRMGFQVNVGIGRVGIGGLGIVQLKIFKEF